MINFTNAKNVLSSSPRPVTTFTKVVVLVMAIGLSACTAAPTKTAKSTADHRAQHEAGMSAAANLYNKRDYSGAILEFNRITKDKAASANSRRLAHLGNALVYLGPDEDLHSVDNAKLSLMSAGQVAPSAGEEFSIETDMLMDAISAVIGTESKYAVLVSKSQGRGHESSQLKRELESVKAERDELIAEQNRLNNTIEKLKALTLGN